MERLPRAYSPAEILTKKYKTIDFTGDWFAAFRRPEMTGVWLIWGNSGNGKTSFIMQLCKELTKYGTVAYDSLEESTCLTLQENMQRYNLADIPKGKFKVLDCEPINILSMRLARRKSPDFVIIDSFQYTQLNYKKYVEFKEKHRNKLLIFISHADGSQPAGRSAKTLMFDASLKILVQGYRAISKGRYIGDTGYYDIWPEKSALYWGSKQVLNNM